MSQKLSAFLDAIETDPEVLSRVRDALPENAPLTPDMFLTAAQAAGFSLSKEDLPIGPVRLDERALDEQALEDVSGGVGLRDLRPGEIPSIAWQKQAWSKIWNKLFG